MMLEVLCILNSVCVVRMHSLGSSLGTPKRKRKHANIEVLQSILHTCSNQLMLKQLNQKGGDSSG